MKLRFFRYAQWRTSVIFLPIMQICSAVSSAPGLLRTLIHKKYVYLLPVLLAITATHCKKEDQVESGGLVSSCGAPLKANTVLELIADPDDAYNHKNNMIMYHYAQSIRKAILNPSFRCRLQDALKRDVAGVGVPISSLIGQNSLLSAEINESLRKSIHDNNIYPKRVESDLPADLLSPSWDANSYLDRKMLYGADDYTPVIHDLGTTKNCEDAGIPVVLLAQEVDECDDIPGWRGENEILMDEKEATSGREWVIIISPGTVTSIMHTNNEPLAIDMNNPKNNGVQNRADVDIDADEHQIKAGHRYETNSRSEISCNYLYYAFTADGTPTWNFWKDFKKSERKIHKDDIAISTNFTNDFDAFTILGSYFDSGVSVVHTNGYEHDWYASMKALPWAAGFPLPTSIAINPSGERVRMKYGHEYYFNDWGYGTALFFQSGYTRTIENSKCRFVLKRTN
jgi:hypothetical protein